VSIDISEAQQKLAEGKCTFIDLRTPEEIIETGKIDGAVELNFHDSEFNSKLAALDKSKPYVIYCKAGGRSGKTLEITKKLGFQEVYDMSDGFLEWKERTN
jgi:rhodanese-related sulfurtransferase